MATLISHLKTTSQEFKENLIYMKGLLAELSTHIEKIHWGGGEKARKGSVKGMSYER